MTIDDPHPDDELAAAYLDGDANATERAQVESDADLLDRVEQFRTIRNLVAAPTPLDDHLADPMIEQALTAFHMAAEEPRDLGGNEEHAIPLPPIAPAIQLDQRRRSGRRASRIPAPGLVAAAVVVLLLIGAGLVITANDGSRVDQTSQGPVGDEDKADSGGQAESFDTSARSSENRSAESEDQSVASASADDLGDFPDAAALRDAINERPTPPIDREGDDTVDGLGSTAAESSPPAPQSDQGPSERCAAVVTSIDPELGALLEVVEASVEDRPVWVFTHGGRDDSSALTVTVVDQQTCKVEFALAR